MSNEFDWNLEVCEHTVKWNDCRVLPGITCEDFYQAVKARLIKELEAYTEEYIFHELGGRTKEVLYNIREKK